MEPSIYHLENKEVHMFGDYVAVVWNCEQEKRTLKGEDGIIYRADVPVRNGTPYIDFISLQHDGEEVYEDDDSPVDGGLNAGQALQVAQELELAARYLEAQPQ